MTRASICTIGDEILIGQVTDTNSGMISRALGNIGIQVNRMISIGDVREEIVSNLERELQFNDIVLVTGGLGPTKDDITKGALAELSGSSSYVEHKEQAAIVREILHSRGLEVLDINEAQAFVPDTCEVIPNRFGTAPIMVFRFDASRFGHETVLYSMPGVPFETEHALSDVLDDIKSHFSLSDISHRTIMTYGYAESALSKKIESWENGLKDRNIHLAYLPDPLKGVRLRLSIYGGEEERNKAMLDAEISGLKAILGDAIYSETDDTLEHALGALLKAHHKTLSVAESCTGGEISHLITTVSGSSEYYLGSVTSYAIPVKENVLGVPAETIEKNGVVSSEVAAAMAEGVRKLMGADFSVATTGLAGKEGDGTNPGGTVWIAVSSGKMPVQTRKFNYHNDRKRNIERFAASALYFLLAYIKSCIND